jgi:hypothetical protein
VGSFFVNPVISTEQFRLEHTAPGPRYRVDDRVVKVPAALIRALASRRAPDAAVGVSPFRRRRS